MTVRVQVTIGIVGYRKTYGMLCRASTTYQLSHKKQPWNSQFARCWIWHASRRGIRIFSLVLHHHCAGFAVDDFSSIHLDRYSWLENKITHDTNIAGSCILWSFKYFKIHNSRKAANAVLFGQNESLYKISKNLYQAYSDPTNLPTLFSW